MKLRLPALAMVPAMLLLAGCGQAEEAVQNAASSAASGVANAAAEQVKGQICALLEDGLVSASDKAVLTGLVAGAETAGVPSEITDPLTEIAEAGDEVPNESVKQLQQACTAG
ncbi:hypothetical protein [Arthrobacter sp. NPDC093139]|jgi:hypothetical protein|uniref:hypothetical protein n=1 Tax=Arthrobacter sp. NPDC093139 TaxID=3363945 RepID=UPI003829A0F9